MMKHQRGDAGASMLVIMAVMMLGFWIFSSRDGGHGGGGHHLTGEHGGAHAEQSTPEKTGSDKTQSLGVPPTVIDYQERAPGATS